MSDKKDQLKRSVGRPPKTNPNDPQAIIKQLEFQTRKFNAKCADKLDTLFDVVYNVAVNKSGPLKDRVLAAKYCIEHAEDYLKAYNKKEEEGGVIEEEWEEEGKEGDAPKKAPLISLKSVD